MYVITNTLSKLEGQNFTPISRDIAKEVAKLKEGNGSLLHVTWKLRTYSRVNEP